MSLFGDFLHASGIRILAGKKGLVYNARGQIHFKRSPRIGIDSNLFACLKIAVDQTGLTIEIADIDHATKGLRWSSRRWQGLSVDIRRVVKAGAEVGAMQPNVSSANLTNRKAAELVDYLLVNGFKCEEKWGWPAVLWGPPHSRLNPTGTDHSLLIHVSLPRRIQAK